MGRPVTSAPSNITRPPLAGREPDIRLNSVVLPAPLGPISPWISPVSTVSETSFTATSPPNRRVSPVTSSRATGQPCRSAAGTAAWRRRCNRSRQPWAAPMRPVGISSTEATRIRPNAIDLILADRSKPLRHQRQQHRPDDRAADIRKAADDDEDQRVDGVFEGEHQRTDVADIGGVETAGEAGEERRNDERDQLEARHVDADRAGEQVALADAPQHGAEPGTADPVDHPAGDQHQHQAEVIERHLVHAGEDRAGRWRRDVAYAVPASERIFEIGEYAAHDLAERQRDQEEIDAFDPQAQAAHRRADHRGHDGRQRQRHPERPASQLRQQAVVIAPMNMNPAWPNEISPVIPSSHMADRHDDVDVDHDHHVQEIFVPDHHAAATPAARPRARSRF